MSADAFNHNQASGRAECASAAVPSADLLPLPVISFGLDGEIRYVNAAAEPLVRDAHSVLQMFQGISADFLAHARQLGRFQVDQEIYLGEETHEFSWKFDLHGDVFVGGAADTTFRRSAEELIQRYETTTSLIESSQSGGTWDYELDRGIEHYSPGFYRVLGYEPFEFPSRREVLLSFVHPDDLPRVAEAFSAYLNHETEQYQVEFRVRTKSGDYRWVASRGAAIFDQNGVPTRLSGGIADIHPRKVAEIQLRSSERLLAEACAMANLGIWVFHPESQTIELSAELAGIHGFEPEPRTMSLHEVASTFYPEDLDRVLRAMEQAQETDEGLRVNFRIQHASGAIRYVEVFTRRVFDDCGKLLLFGVLNDVTDSTTYAERISSQRSFLRRVIDNVPSPIYVKNRAGQFVLANEAAASLLGVTMDQLLGKTDADFTEIREAAAKIERIDRAIFGNELPTPYSFDERFVYADGSFRWLHTTKQLIESLDSEEPQILAICNDLTSLLQNQAELEKAREEALESSRLKSEFLANMSHEIRTPMNGVLGMADLLMDTALCEEQRELVNTIRESGNSLMLILNDILDFSKIEAGKMALELQDVDLVDLVEGIAMLFMPRAIEKGLQFGISVQWGPDWILRTDPLRLQQVLSNLVGNAIKFTEQGRVEIRLRSEDTGRIRITIADSGAGMNEESLARIFNSFVQVDGSSTRRHGGTGLGLAISKHLTELLGGTIGVTSNVGIGSNFFVEFPATALSTASPKRPLSGKKVNLALENPVKMAALVGPFLRLGAELVIDEEDILVDDPNLGPEEVGFYLPGTSNVCGVLNEPFCCRRILQVLNRMLEVKVSEPVRRRSTKQGRVLLVEDNNVNRAVASRILHNLNYEVVTATNGREGVEAVLGQRFSCILMDLQMPEMDGIEATSKIREMESKLGFRTPIIALTAHAMSGDRERCFEVGMDDYLTKPIRKDQLTGILDKWISDTPMEEKQLDLSYLSEIAGDDLEFQRDVLSAYVEGLPPMLAELRDAADRGDRKAAYRVVHTLKGSSRSIGANLFATYCEGMEKSVLDGDLAMIAVEVAAKSEQVIRECEVICQATAA